MTAGPEPIATVTAADLSWHGADWTRQVLEDLIRTGQVGIEGYTVWSATSPMTPPFLIFAGVVSDAETRGG